MANFSHRERVVQAILRQPADRPPRGELCIDDAVIAEFCGCRQDAVSFAERRQFLRMLNFDLICISPSYRAGDRIVPASADEVQWPDLARWAAETDLFPFVLIDGPLGWGIRLWGFEECLLKIVKKDQDIAALVSDIENLNRALAAKARQGGAAGILLADDIAYQNGPILSPAMLRDNFFGSYQRQIASFKELELYAFFHSDGNLTKVFDLLVETGVDGLQCLEEAAGMDLGWLQQMYGDRVCLWGNLDPACLTGPQTAMPLEEKVQAAFVGGSRGPGFIFGTSSGLFRGVRIDLLKRVQATFDRLAAR